jgi:hypothetical protein
MTVTIDVTPGEEVWLAEQAEKQGVQPAEIIKQLIDAQLPGSAPLEVPASDGENIDPTEALFAQWAKEDEGRTAEEAAADDKLWHEFEQGINDTRRASGMRLL